MKNQKQEDGKETEGTKRQSGTSLAKGKTASKAKPKTKQTTKAQTTKATTVATKKKKEAEDATAKALEKATELVEPEIIGRPLEDKDTKKALSARETKIKRTNELMAKQGRNEELTMDEARELCDLTKINISE